jgi:hypothetical protein
LAAGRRDVRRRLDRGLTSILGFLKRFVLTSGTLKDLATEYGISYPTVRLRLDRLIQKVRLLDETPAAGPLETRLRALYADGRLDDEAFAELLREYRKEVRREALVE